MDQSRVSRMRKLLTEAVNANPDAVFGQILFSPSSCSPPAQSIRRRAMIKQVQLAAKRYDLQLDVDAYLAAADRASVSGLDNAQLSTLSRWIAGVIDRMALACDSPDAPPAR